jgi:hypothetical protein
MKNKTSHPVFGSTAYFEELPGRVSVRMKRRNQKKWAALSLVPMAMIVFLSMPWTARSGPPREEIVSYLEQEEQLDHEVWFELAESHLKQQP